MPVVGSGLGSSVGIGVEPVYGISSANTRWTEFTSETIEWKPKFYQGQGLAAGNTTAKTTQRVLTNAEGKGAVKTMMFQQGMGPWLSNLTGDTSAPVQQGGGAAYLQTHPWKDITTGVSHQIQKGVADTAGVVHPYTAVGCKVTDAVFTCSADNPLETTWTIDAADVLTTGNAAAPIAVTTTTGTNTTGASTLNVTASTNAPTSGSLQVNGVTYTYSGKGAGTFTGLSQTLASTLTGTTYNVYLVPLFVTPTFLTSNPEFHWGQMSLSYGTLGSEVPLAGVRKFQATIKRPYDDKRFFADGTGRKNEPIQNGWSDFQIDLDMDYIDTTALVDKMVSQSTFSLIATWTNPTAIATTFFPFFKMAFPACKVNTETPKVPGPAVIQPKISINALYDESHTPCTLSYQSIDTAL